MYDALVDQIREALGRRGGSLNTRAAAALVRGMHPSDLAAILDELTPPEAERVFALLDDARAAEALSQVAPATSRYLIETSSAPRVLALLRRLPADDVAEVVSDAGAQGRSLLALLPGAAARDVEHEHAGSHAGVCSVRELLMANVDDRVDGWVHGDGDADVVEPVTGKS